MSRYLKDLPWHQLFRAANFVLSKVFKGCFYLDVDSKRPSLQVSVHARVDQLAFEEKSPTSSNRTVCIVCIPCTF